MMALERASPGCAPPEFAAPEAASLAGTTPEGASPGCAGCSDAGLAADIVFIVSPARA
jgi:hypothetical protein